LKILSLDRNQFENNLYFTNKLEVGYEGNKEYFDKLPEESKKKIYEYVITSNTYNKVITQFNDHILYAYDVYQKQIKSSTKSPEFLARLRNLLPTKSSTKSPEFLAEQIKLLDDTTNKNILDNLDESIKQFEVQRRKAINLVFTKLSKKK